MKRKFQLKFYEKIIILLLVLIATLLIFSYTYNPIIIEGNTKAKVYEKGNDGSKEFKKSVEKDNGKRDEVKTGTNKAFESHAKMVGE